MLRKTVVDCYDDVAPRYDDAVKLVKSLDDGNSHFVIVGTSFYTGISQKLLRLAKQRKATVIVIDENAAGGELLVAVSEAADWAEQNFLHHRVFTILEM